MAAFILMLPTPLLSQIGITLRGLPKTSRSAGVLKRVQSSKEPNLATGAYTKVADLRVHGYQAVKVIYEYRQQRDTESEPELPLPPMYAVMVYIEKGADIWEVASYAWNKESQQKSVPTFEVILRTLKF